MNTEKPTNLQQAVELQLEKMEIHPVWNVTSKFAQETDLSPTRVSEATLEALREMGIKKAPLGDLLVEAYLENSKKPNNLSGKEV